MCDPSDVRESNANRKDQGFHFQQGLDVAERCNLKNGLHAMVLRSCVSIQVIHCLHVYEVVSREWREYRIRFEASLLRIYKTL